MESECLNKDIGNRKDCRADASSESSRSNTPEAKSEQDLDDKKPNGGEDKVQIKVEEEKSKESSEKEESEEEKKDTSVCSNYYVRIAEFSVRATE